MATSDDDRYCWTRSLLSPPPFPRGFNSSAPSRAAGSMAKDGVGQVLLTTKFSNKLTASVRPDNWAERAAAYRPRGAQTWTHTAGTSYYDRLFLLFGMGRDKSSLFSLSLGTYHGHVLSSKGQSTLL